MSTLQVGIQYMLCVSLWTLSDTRLLPSLLLVLACCVFWDAQTPLNCADNEENGSLTCAELPEDVAI